MTSKELQARTSDHERSVSDGDLEVEKKRRKTRRRRANKNRFKPYHSLSPEEKIALDAAETARSERRIRERLVAKHSNADFEFPPLPLSARITFCSHFLSSSAS